MCLPTSSSSWPFSSSSGSGSCPGATSVGPASPMMFGSRTPTSAPRRRRTVRRHQPDRELTSSPPVPASPASAAEGEPRQPDYGQDDGYEPQGVDGEAQPTEEQCQQQDQKDESHSVTSHGRRVPTRCSRSTPAGRIPNRAFQETHVSVSST